MGCLVGIRGTFADKHRCVSATSYDLRVAGVRRAERRQNRYTRNVVTRTEPRTPRVFFAQVVGGTGTHEHLEQDRLREQTEPCVILAPASNSVFRLDHRYCVMTTLGALPIALLGWCVR